MTDPYPEARRRARLDTTDHGKFIEENKEYLAQERAKRLKQKIADLKRAQRHRPGDDGIQRDIEDAKAELEQLNQRFGQ
jgi:hypothetical protein